MNKIFIPINKGKNKAMVRGFWYDKNTKKTFYDYIEIIEKGNIHLNFVKRLQKKHKQLAIFFVVDDIGYVYTNKKNCIVLHDKIKITISKKFSGLKKIIKTLLKKYEGLTVYIQDKSYIIECYYN